MSGGVQKILQKSCKLVVGTDIEGYEKINTANQIYSGLPKRRGVITMEINAEKSRIARSVLALIVAAMLVIGSVFTVAAAVQSADETEIASVDNANNTTTSEYELASGDILITSNNNLSYSTDVIKANKITIVDGSNSTLVVLARGTVADALEKANITLDDTQVVVPSQDTEITEDTTVTIETGVQIAVTADGETKDVIVENTNIADALNNAGYKLSEDDILSVARDTEVTENMSVTIKRVTYKDEVSTEKIDYDTTYENTDELELGETKVKTEGKAGEKEITTRVKYIDGTKDSEKVVDTKTTKEPVKEVILRGTKGASVANVAGTFTDYNGTTVAYSKVISGSGTAYTASAGALTATGVPAYHGGVAVNPSIIPYGSKLYITSTDGSVVYGYATAVDTGGALMEGSALVDCFYDSYSECVSFGRQNVNVYIIG
jgi:uncharacterized protein YabE (DUF348 family)